MQVVNVGGHTRKTRRVGRRTMGSKEAIHNMSMSWFLMWEKPELHHPGDGHLWNPREHISQDCLSRDKKAVEDSLASWLRTTGYLLNSQHL